MAIWAAVGPGSAHGCRPVARVGFAYILLHPLFLSGVVGVLQVRLLHQSLDLDRVADAGVAGDCIFGVDHAAADHYILPAHQLFFEGFLRRQCLVVAIRHS